MTITKEKNNRFRIREMKNGQVVSISIDHKPTKKEAEELIKEKREKLEKKIIQKENKTLYECIEEYIGSKSKILSPSTILGYTKIKNKLNDNYDILNKDIREITKLEMQKFINDYSTNHSPKTVRNVWSLIKVVLEMYIENFYMRITLPQRIRKEPYIPNDNDIKILLKNCENTEFSIPIKLALYGLRKSEIFALDLQDIGDGEISINKAKVPSLYGPKIKATKSSAGTRVVKVSKKLTDEIKNKGYIIKNGDNSLNKFMNKVEKENSLKHFSLHKLRHYYASIQHTLGIPDKYIMQQIGHSSDTILKQIYTHCLSDKDYSQKTVSYLENLCP